jgi:hypothetical protein
MSNWALPTLSSTYTNFLSEVSARIDDAGKMGRSDTVTLTSPPVGYIRWNTSTSRWEANTGTVGAPVWSALAATYGINVSTASAWATGRTVGVSGDATGTSAAWTGSGNISFAVTLATVNGNIGAFGSTIAVPVITVNAKGLITAMSTAALGTIATQAANAVAITGGAVSGVTLTVKAGTGPTAEGVMEWSTTGDLLMVGTGAATKVMVDTNGTQTLTGKTISLASNTLTLTSAQLLAAVSDSNGTGTAVFATSPTLAGVPITPTAAAGANTTQIASTAHVFAERANTATLTNKTLNLTSNTLAMTKAQLNSAVSDATIASAGANGDITSLAALTSINGGPLAGMRNRIINGDLGITQRGLTPVTTSDTYGPHDRFRTITLGNTFSCANGSFVSGDALFDSGGAANFMQNTVTSVAGAGNYTIWIQTIEGVRLLAGKTVTVSFWGRVAAGSSSIGISIDQLFGTGGSVQVTGVGQAQALTTTWTRYSKTFSVASINGKTLGTETTDNNSVLFWLNSGADFAVRSGSIGQASKIVSIAQVQVEEGSVATAFEQRPIGIELALCQRYYEIGSSYYEGYVFAGGPVGSFTPYKVTKRIAPSGGNLAFPVFTNVQNASVGAVRNVYTTGFERYALAASTAVATARETFIANAEI